MVCINATDSTEPGPNDMRRHDLCGKYAAWRGPDAVRGGTFAAASAVGLRQPGLHGRWASQPFGFLPRRKRRIIPHGTLVFCRSIKDLTRRAGPIGRALLRRGFPIAAIDANGPVPGLQGWFMQGKHKYFRGPRPPRFGAYSELVIVGGNVPIAAGAAN
jgi:hypothetical protein